MEVLNGALPVVALSGQADGMTFVIKTAISGVHRGAILQ